VSPLFLGSGQLNSNLYDRLKAGLTRNLEDSGGDKILAAVDIQDPATTSKLELRDDDVLLPTVALPGHVLATQLGGIWGVIITLLHLRRLRAARIESATGLASTAEPSKVK